MANNYDHPQFQFDFRFGLTMSFPGEKRSKTLLDLPEELLLQILTNVFEEAPYYKNKATPGLLRVCKTIHRITEPLLYSVSGYAYSPRSCRLLMRRLTERPDLAKRIRRVDARPVLIRDVIQGGAPNVGDFIEVANTIDFKNKLHLFDQLFRGNQAAEAIVLLSKLSNLTALTVRVYGNVWEWPQSCFYMLLDAATASTCRLGRRPLVNLKEIKLTWSRACKYGIFGTVSKMVLSLPSIRSVRGIKFLCNPRSNHVISEPVFWFKEQWNGTSAIEHITLSSDLLHYRGAVTTGDVHLACKAPRALQSLAFRWTCDLFNRINTTALLPALELQRASLRRLEVQVDGADEPFSMQAPLPSLKTLTGLKTLVVSAVLLTANGNFERYTPTWTCNWDKLADVFPTSLEELVITNECQLERFMSWMFPFMTNYKTLGPRNFRRIELAMTLPPWAVDSIREIWRDLDLELTEDQGLLIWTEW